MFDIRVPISQGRLNTGYHSVSLNLASIASHLPPSAEEAVKLDAAAYETELLYNKAEATERPVIWDAEDLGEQDSEAEMEEASLAQNCPASMRKPKPLNVPAELQDAPEPKSPTRASGSKYPVRTTSELTAKPVGHVEQPKSLVPSMGGDLQKVSSPMPHCCLLMVQQAQLNILPGTPNAAVPLPTSSTSGAANNSPMQIDLAHRPPPFDELAAFVSLMSSRHVAAYLPLQMNRASSMSESFMPTQSLPPPSPPHERIADLHLEEPDIDMESQYPETAVSTIATNVLKEQMQALAHHAGDDIGSPEPIEEDSPETPFAPSQAAPRPQKVSMDLDLADDPIKETPQVPSSPLSELSLVEDLPVDKEVGNDSGIVNFVPPNRSFVDAARDRATDAHLLESQLSDAVNKQKNEASVKDTQGDAETQDGENSDPCDCGDSTFEGTMAACDHCALWVHICCYGFVLAVCPSAFD